MRTALVRAMRGDGAGPVLVTLALSVLVVAGCAPTGVDVRGTLPLCRHVRVLPVEELAEHTKCDLRGWRLMFPDGQTFEVGVANGSASSTDRPGEEWGASNWGGDGTVAWLRTDEGLTVWGPPAAVDREILLLSLDVD
ncbi:hypothetical protein [Cellulomonas endometrii]|uniref:hypothetical protein n=1 Tax=Cellulomonas endometrii TaxID=3036301 RepID=UPI0024ACE708|nr:hypothetical protein [Cellulomonas endometrii]